MSYDEIMFDYALFLGFPLSPAYREALACLSPAVYSLFVCNQNSTYLQEVTHQGQLYLGKYLEAPLELASLDSMQMHIYSLLKRLVEAYPHHLYSLTLLAVPHEPIPL